VKPFYICFTGDFTFFTPWDRKIYKVFFIVTNIADSPLEILLWHRKRCGKSEQEHSRLTKDMAGGRFPSDSFGENAAWWYLSKTRLLPLVTDFIHQHWQYKVGEHLQIYHLI